MCVHFCVGVVAPQTLVPPEPAVSPDVRALLADVRRRFPLALAPSATDADADGGGMGDDAPPGPAPAPTATVTPPTVPSLRSRVAPALASRLQAWTWTTADAADAAAAPNDDGFDDDEDDDDDDDDDAAAMDAGGYGAEPDLPPPGTPVVPGMVVPSWAAGSSVGPAAASRYVPSPRVPAATPAPPRFAGLITTPGMPSGGGGGGGEAGWSGAWAGGGGSGLASVGPRTGRASEARRNTGRSLGSRLRASGAVEVVDLFRMEPGALNHTPMLGAAGDGDDVGDGDDGAGEYDGDVGAPGRGGDGMQDSAPPSGLRGDAGGAPTGPRASHGLGPTGAPGLRTSITADAVAAAVGGHRSTTGAFPGEAPPRGQRTPMFGFRTGGGGGGGGGGDAIHAYPGDEDGFAYASPLSPLPMESPFATPGVGLTASALKPPQPPQPPQQQQQQGSSLGLGLGLGLGPRAVVGVAGAASLPLGVQGFAGAAPSAALDGAPAAAGPTARAGGSALPPSFASRAPPVVALAGPGAGLGAGAYDKRPAGPLDAAGPLGGLQSPPAALFQRFGRASVAPHAHGGRASMAVPSFMAAGAAPTAAAAYQAPVRAPASDALGSGLGGRFGYPLVRDVLRARVAGQGGSAVLPPTRAAVCLGGSVTACVSRMRCPPSSRVPPSFALCPCACGCGTGGVGCVRCA
jgi:hypothetical protein